MTLRRMSKSHLKSHQNHWTLSSCCPSLVVIFSYASPLIFQPPPPPGNYYTVPYRTEFLLLGKEISLFFSAGQVACHLFFTVSHLVFPVKQLSNFMPSSLLSLTTESSWLLLILSMVYWFSVWTPLRNFLILTFQYFC